MIQNDRMPPQYFLGAVKTQRNVPPVVKRQRWENADGTVRRKATEYHDYTAFVGRPIRTDFLRVRESDGAWIRVSSDSMLYAERPTSVDMRGVTGNDADFVSKNIGLEIEKWSVSRRLDCGSGHCNGEDGDP